MDINLTQAEKVDANYNQWREDLLADVDEEFDADALLKKIRDKMEMNKHNTNYDKAMGLIK